MADQYPPEPMHAETDHCLMATFYRMLDDPTQPPMSRRRRRTWGLSHHASPFAIWRIRRSSEKR